MEERSQEQYLGNLVLSTLSPESQLEIVSQLRLLRQRDDGFEVWRREWRFPLGSSALIPELEIPVINNQGLDLSHPVNWPKFRSNPDIVIVVEDMTKLYGSFRVRMVKCIVDEGKGIRYFADHYPHLLLWFHTLDEPQEQPSLEENFNLEPAQRRQLFQRELIHLASVTDKHSEEVCRYAQGLLRALKRPSLRDKRR